MELGSDNVELLAFSRSGTTTDESEVEHINKRRQSRRKPQSRTPSRNLNFIARSLDTRDVFTKWCWNVLLLFLIGNLLWIFGLTWVASHLRTDMHALRNITDKVSAGSDVIPESIQKCHSLTRQLEKNQSHITMQLHKISQHILNISTLIDGIQTNISKLERKVFESSPTQVMPDVERIGVTIAAFKAEILDMETKTSNIDNEHTEMKKMIDGLAGNVTSCNKDLQEFKKLSAGISPSNQIKKDDLVNQIIREMEPKIRQFNAPVLSQVKWLSDDLQKAQKTISNLTDESEYLKSLVNTTLHDLKLQSHDIISLRSDIKTHTKEWDDLILVTKTLEKNVSELVKTCSNCKYSRMEDSVTSTSAEPSTSEMANFSTSRMKDIAV